MPFLKAESPIDVQKVVQAVEDQADKCYDGLSLLSRPRNEAIWALLTGTIDQLEYEMARWGSNSREFVAAITNLGRTAPVALSGIEKHGESESTSIRKYRWTPSLRTGVGNALVVTHQYGAFLNTYPLWHRDRLRAELLAEGVVRFSFPWGARARQVSAYQKIFRPREGKFQNVDEKRTEQALETKQLFEQVLENARPTGPYSFSYSESAELDRALSANYRARVDTIGRRSDTLDLGGYALGEFKAFYAALLVVCAIHEFVCFAWAQRGNLFPISSALLLKPRSAWLERLTALSGLSRSKCDQMLIDLTSTPGRSVDINVFPFVQVDELAQTLAVVPHFPLYSRWDENILRSCSYRRPRFHAITSTEKEGEQRDALVSAISQYRVEGPVDLPAPNPDVDLIIEDVGSSTVVLAELKWIRVPLKPLERLERDAEVIKGIFQLREIKKFVEENPSYLLARGKLMFEISKYDYVYYLLVATDHWLWVEQVGPIAIVDSVPFTRLLRESDNLASCVSELLRYEWLPVEGRDFDVRYDRAFAGGVSIESEVFYSRH
jgi:hypothetical protein